MRRRRKILWGLVAVLTVAARPLPAQVVEVPTFEVASRTVGQFISDIDVAAGPDGTIMFIWDELRYEDGMYEGAMRNAILTRRLAPDGRPLGPPIRVDSSGYACCPRISVSPLGGYIAAWGRFDNTAPVDAAICRLLDATGAPSGSEIVLEWASRWPDKVTALSGSPFFWLSGFDATLYGPDGTKISITEAIDYSAQVYYVDEKALPDVGFIFTWFDALTHSSSGRLFGPDGQPLGPAFLLSDRMAVSHVAVSPLGGFAVVGSYTDQTNLQSWGDTNRLFVRRFADDGSPLTEEVLVYEGPPGVEIPYPDLEFNQRGDLYVVWADLDFASGFSSMHPPKARAFDANGTPYGPPVSISDTPGYAPSAAVLANGSFVNVWEGEPGYEGEPARNRVYANVVKLCQAGPCSTPAPAVCGDGIVEPGEECDDGNLIDGDGCDSDCTITSCGNGIITDGELCDDGNQINGDGCDNNCTFTGCGNGIVTAGEQCDDGNQINGDGCESDCTLTPQHHDTVVLPVNPLNVVMKAGVDEVSLTLHIQVRNADISPKPEKPGHIVQLVGDDGNCPYTVADVPDFGTAADQYYGPDYSLVPGGATRTASVPLLIERYYYDDSDPRVAQRCTLTFTADAVLKDYPNVDPTPENNTIQVELNVYVYPNPEDMMVFNPMAAFSQAQVSPTPAPFFIVSAKPVSVTLPAHAASVTKKADVKVTTGGAVGAAQPAQTITVVASDGDCPAGTVSVSDFNPRVGGAQNVVTLGPRKTAQGKLPLTIAAAGFTSRNAKSPARCTALITSTADGTSGPTNHVTKLLIEVTDHNDF